MSTTVNSVRVSLLTSPRLFIFLSGGFPDQAYPFCAFSAVHRQPPARKPRALPAVLAAECPDVPYAAFLSKVMPLSIIFC